MSNTLRLRAKRAVKAARPYKVIQYGTDSSGRPILMNQRMEAAFTALCEKLGATPTITQGAYMARLGGGASDSAGYHDAGGALDLRVWDLASMGLTVEQVVHAARWLGWDAWYRDMAHGGFSDPHIHMALHGDKRASAGIRDQFIQYANGQNGLSDRGPDYHPRPNPIVVFDYRKWLKEQAMEADRIIQVVKDEGDRTRKVVNARAVAERERDRRINSAVLKAVDDLPEAATKRDVRVAVAKALADSTTPTT